MREPKVASPDDRIEIVPLNNPFYISSSQEFMEMVKEYATSEMKIPSINAESLHNYLCNFVQGIFDQQVKGMNERSIRQRVLAGYINGKLAGFTLFYMLPNRMPHIQTLDWAYIHTTDNRISYLFAKEVKKCKRLWGAAYISFVAANKHLAKVSRRLFKATHKGGEWLIVKDVNDALLKIGIDT